MPGFGFEGIIEKHRGFAMEIHGIADWRRMSARINPVVMGSWLRRRNLKPQVRGLGLGLSMSLSFLLKVASKSE
jgi:hypothetical protein